MRPDYPGLERVERQKELKQVPEEVRDIYAATEEQIKKAARVMGEYENWSVSDVVRGVPPTRSSFIQFVEDRGEQTLASVLEEIEAECPYTAKGFFRKIKPECKGEYGELSKVISRAIVDLAGKRRILELIGEVHGRPSTDEFKRRRAERKVSELENVAEGKKKEFAADMASLSELLAEFRGCYCGR